MFNFESNSSRYINFRRVRFLGLSISNSSKTEQQYNIFSLHNQFCILFSAKIVRADLVSLLIAYSLYLKIFLHVSSRLSISK